MKEIAFIIGLVSIILFACQENRKSTNQNEVNVEKQDTINDHKAEHDDESTPILLNNGKKWTANMETTEGIKNMNAFLNEFPANPKLEDYHSLKSNMEIEFNVILQKCTMTGEAHNQLHNYLLPMKKKLLKN
jgi:hypothetical protein